jgi:hypothetical protein
VPQPMSVRLMALHWVAVEAELPQAVRTTPLARLPVFTAARFGLICRTLLRRSYFILRGRDGPSDPRVDCELPRAGRNRGRRHRRGRLRRQERTCRYLARPLVAVQWNFQPRQGQFTHWVVDLRNEAADSVNVESMTVVAGGEIIEWEGPMEPPAD